MKARLLKTRFMFMFVLLLVSLVMASCFHVPSQQSASLEKSLGSGTSSEATEASGQPESPLSRGEQAASGPSLWARIFKAPFSRTTDTPESNIISLEFNAKTSLTGLIEELVKADYVLLGEAHDDPVHHQLQNKILELMVEAGRKPAVVFEMFNREDEGLISSTTRSFPSDPDQVAAAVNWEASGWPDWQMYRPIVKTALDAGLPVVAGNLSRAKARQVITDYASFMPNNQTRTQMGMNQPLLKIQQQILQTKIATAHGKAIPDPMVKGMVTAQRMRDATMAEAMIARNLGQGAVLIAGKEHVRTDYGVPHYLRFREPNYMEQYAGGKNHGPS